MEGTEVGLRGAERLVSGPQEVKESLGGGGIKIRKFPRRFQQTFVAREVFQKEMRHDVL